MLSLRNLRYFCAAFEERSTVGAARLCFVTQPAISAAIAQIEEELQVRLFLRQHRGLAPTPAAQRLYRLARKLLADTEAISASFKQGEALPFALRVLPSLSVEHTERLLRQLRREIPVLALSLPDDEAPADAALTAATCADEGTEFVALWEEQYVLLVPEDHPLAVKEALEMADLHAQPFIERSHCEMSESWQAALGRGAVQPDVRARVHSEEWAQGLVAAGVGVTIAPLHAVQARPGVVVRDDCAELREVRRSIGLAFHAPATGTLALVLAACQRWALTLK
jgi:DNA-binding transcriptional LysR family regulator